MLYDIFNFFSKNISRILKKIIENEEFDFLEEIRIRNHQNIILKFNDKEEIVDYIVTRKRNFRNTTKYLRKFYLFVSKRNM